MVDLLLRKSSMIYNLKIAQLLGVMNAIYIQFLLDYRDSMDNLVDGEYFLLSTQQIKINTAIDEFSIKQAEAELVAWSILKLKPVKNSADKFYYSINIELLMSVLNSTNKEEALSLVTKPGMKKSLIVVPVIKEKQVTKKDGLITDIKKTLQESDIEIREKLYNWIDHIAGLPKSYISQYTVQESMKILNNYCKEDKKLKLDIIGIAILNNQRNFEWSVETYEKQKGIKKNVPKDGAISNNTLSDEKFEEYRRAIAAGEVHEF